MVKVKLSAFAAAAAMAIAASPAVAAPTFFATTGHYYEYFGNSLSWSDARADALSRNGYLATITTEAENTFLGTLSSDGWIGGTDEAVEGTFVWADGPEAGTFTYAHWNGSEPNNLGNEDYIQYAGGNWNDLPNSSARGYFVEYNRSAAPEPATWAMMLIGFGMLGFALRSQRKVHTHFA